MRALISSKAVLVATATLLGAAAVPAHAENPAPTPQQTAPPAPSGENQKAPEAAPSPPQASPGPAQQAELEGPVLLNGRLNVPGAPTDGPTVPAKYSKRNDALDNVPILDMPLGLTDAQRQAIVASVQRANAPVQSLKAKPSEELPWHIAMQVLPAAVASVPAVTGLKYVRTSDAILLVSPPNWIVVGEIKK
jgi:hypothetical protein